ncbi:hypothetical protein CY34DRAFT_811353 [Suillus luteus UH-Slu-Lm8-n1]|uniref:Unplaced genomic scaffold CY34scaffold_405, whole genome shotgun sequence n=1 Tax=Suillus luteus UH-Slu-Lm8-n1 TaxID=930992 RepID=A0A0D0APS0_9AGAM|nr:hypothetical protein CY34DRAFT_811353 [Suillus luteus UH-Slu-Lm8-n1]
MLALQGKYIIPDGTAVPSFFPGSNHRSSEWRTQTQVQINRRQDYLSSEKIWATLLCSGTSATSTRRTSSRIVHLSGHTPDHTP